MNSLTGFRSYLVPATLANAAVKTAETFGKQLYNKFIDRSSTELINKAFGYTRSQPYKGYYRNYTPGPKWYNRNRRYGKYRKWKYRTKRYRQYYRNKKW
jgi:hypothetical protein